MSASIRAGERQARELRLHFHRGAGAAQVRVEVANYEPICASQPVIHLKHVSSCTSCLVSPVSLVNLVYN